MELSRTSLRAEPDENEALPAILCMLSLARLDARRRELEAQREDLSRELVRKAFRIAELERDLAKTQETYETSLSWRVTRPLRTAKVLLARRRGDT